MARRGPVRGPSHPCKGCNERYRRHGSVASVQLARRLQEAILLIIRRSWVRAPPAPHTLTCGNVRFGPAGQRTYRIDAGMVAAMTLAERFAEHGKRRQKPWLARLEPVRPGPVARHSSLTRHPGPKPPPFARRGAGGHGRRRVRGTPQPERLSTRHLRGAAPTADARPHATARQAPIRPLRRTTSRAGPRPAQGII